MEMSTISVRVPAEDKKNFEIFCKNTGMNITTAINMYIKVVLAQKTIPFIIKDEIPISNDIPNEITQASFKESDRLAKKKDEKGWININEMRKDLGL